MNLMSFRSFFSMNGIDSELEPSGFRSNELAPVLIHSDSSFLAVVNAKVYQVMQQRISSLAYIAWPKSLRT